MDDALPSEAPPGDPRMRKQIAAESVLRASDADRERAAAALQAAAADGRVSFAELDERLGLAYSATSKDELVSIVKDLQSARWASRTPTAAKDVGVLSGFVRKGRWLVGGTHRATAVICSGVIDLREAQFTAPEATIRVNSCMGTVYVVVPDHAEVQVAGTGILGGFKQDRKSADYPAAPRITVTGVAVCGNVYVVHQPLSSKDRRAQRRERRSIRR